MVDVFEIEIFARVMCEKEPIPTPCNVARNAVDGDILREPVARNVLHRNRAIVVQLRGDDSDRRLDSMRAFLDATEVRERGNDADGAVPAHSQVADVIEEDDTGGRIRIDRRNE